MENDPAAPSASAHDRSFSALWYEAKRKLTVRTNSLRSATEREITLRAQWSGVSRGTEKLVCDGLVPTSEAERMACPHQLGQFPFPVMYGYGFVGEIVDGARERRGRAAFCLHPHATYAVVPETDVHLVPYGLPARRAILTANMETALNVVWDARISGGDRVVVMGAGVVGLLVGYLAAQFPGATVLVCDPDPSRRALAETLGCEVVAPDAAAEWVDANDGLPFDVAINASASGEALTAAIDLLGVEGRVVEASWFGARSVDLRLGGAFHSQRLQIVSSQVGRIPADRQARWTYARRIAVALRLLDDDRLDTLITHEVAFDEAPDVLPPLFDDPEALGIALKYPTAERRAPSAR